MDSLQQDTLSPARNHPRDEAKWKYFGELGTEEVLYLVGDLRFSGDVFFVLQTVSKI